MKKYLKLRRKRDELGVVAIIAALLAVVLLMFAAYAVDIGLQVNRKHQLQDTLDSAAQAGAFALPGSSITAKADALAFALAHDPTETGSLKPNVDFWCVVASKLTSGVYQPDSTQMPSTCYPGTAPYTSGVNYKATGLKTNCSSKLCAIPCVERAANTGTPKIECNTIRVFQGRTVPFGFAPAGGIQQGSTGNVISVACKGSCGTIAPNPMDVAIVADRTPSMSQTNVDLMVKGIQDMLKVMTPSQQYVALGTIGRSTKTTTATAASGACNSTSKGLTWPGTPTSGGLWMPIAFSRDYVDGAGALKTSDPLVKGVQCIKDAGQGNSPAGTFLASPLKAAARYLLDSSNTSSMPVRTPTPRKVLIFETDGQPYEVNTTGGSTSLGAAGDVDSNPASKIENTTTTGPTTTGPVATTAKRSVQGTGKPKPPPVEYTDTYNTTTTTTTSTKTVVYNGGQNACSNFADVATKAKAEGILVITIAYNLTDERCGDNNTSTPANTNDSNDVIKITNVTPTAAKKTAPDGTISVDPNYAGDATVTRTITRTTTIVNYSQAPDFYVGNILAAAASEKAPGVPSTVQTCATTAGQAAENADGDYFFCAASGADMAPIFKTALAQASKGIKLLKGW